MLGKALDKIPFNKSLDMNMELWHWTKTNVGYALATFFYLRPEAEASQAFDPEQAKKEVRFAESGDQAIPVMVSNSIQGEKMEPVRIDRGRLFPRSYANRDWEEDAHMVWWSAEDGDVIAMQFKSPQCVTNANLELQLTQSANYGIVTLSVNRSKEVTFDRYAPEIKEEQLTMEDVSLKKGWNRIKVEVQGKNPEATDHVFGLDCLKVK